MQAARVLERPTIVSDNTSILDKTPGDRLRLLRLDHNLSQGDIAESLGISRAAYTQYETQASKVSIERAVELAEILGSTPEWIAFGSGVRSSLRAAHYSLTKGFYKQGNLSGLSEWTRDRVGAERAACVVAYRFPASLDGYEAGDIALVEQLTEATATLRPYIYADNDGVHVAALARSKHAGRIQVTKPDGSQTFVYRAGIEILGEIIAVLAAP